MEVLSVTPNSHHCIHRAEHGPNIDLLGTSPKASLGQYTSWQEAVPWRVVDVGSSFQICCCLCGLRSQETELLVSLEWGLRLKLWPQC